MRCFKGCFGSKETKKLLQVQNQHQQPLLPCNKEEEEEEEEEEIIEPVKEIAVLLRSEIKSKEKINRPNERKSTRACVDDEVENENLMENEKPEIKNKNREENDKEDDDNDGGGMLHSIRDDINASSKNDPMELLQERIAGDQKTTTSMDSTESLFSLSIDSRKQFWTITEEQQGDKEVNSPLKDITSRVESYDENHLHFAGQRLEVRIDGKKKPSIRHKDDKENVKSNENQIEHTMKEKNSIDLQKLKPLSGGTKENVIDTASFSSWLGVGGSSENESLNKRSRRNNASNSPESEKNYDVERSVKVERKEFKESVESTPSCSVGDDGDERYSEGTIGRYLQTKKRFKTSIASVQT